MTKCWILIAPVAVLIVLSIGLETYMPLLFSVLRRVSKNKMADAAVRSYVSGSLSLMYVTVPDIQTGKKLARPLIEKKQAACVNIIPQITSVYEWEGKIEEDNEAVMLIKTATSNVDMISKYIREHHPYDVAAAISVKIDNGNPPFLDWVADTVKDASQLPTKAHQPDES